MSASAELQKLIFDTLSASTPVMEIVAGIYDKIPEEPYGSKTAYISFGSSDVVDDSADCIIAGEHTLQVDVWSIAVGKVEAKRLVDMIYRALNDQDLLLSENALVYVTVGIRRVFMDADGLTTHGVVPVTVLIEEF